MIAGGLASTSHPIDAHIIPMRRCNLACAYCNEYDDSSKPVPLDTMNQRLDHLAKLGTAIITISGGEPLLHPELDSIIARVRHHGMIAGMITNGYLLTADRVKRLNRAGLDHLQISIDNVMPDEVSKKSLKVLDKKLQLLSEHADFHVNINSVVGGGIHNPKDALTIGKRALELGFTSTVGIIHDGGGQLQPLRDEEREVYSAMRSMFAAARLSGQAPGGVHHRGHPARIPHGKGLRAPLHRGLRPSGLDDRLLARTAGPAAFGGRGPVAAAGATAVGIFTLRLQWAAIPIRTSRLYYRYEDGRFDPQ